MTASDGLTLEEGKQINKSLSALSNVLQALSGTRAAHVPYRDSKLTRLLQDALSGGGATAIVLCCSPSARSVQETLLTMRFGARAQGIVNTMQVLSAEPVEGEDWEAAVKDLKAELGALKAENARLTEEVERRVHAAVPRIIIALQAFL